VAVSQCHAVIAFLIDVQFEVHFLAPQRVGEAHAFVDRHELIFKGVEQETRR